MKQRVFILSSFLLLYLGNYLSAQTLNYYFGNLHSHSGYSDGNKDSTTSGCSRPVHDYAFAKASQHFDFLGISEHNHYSSAHNPGMQLPRYAYGLSEAAAANQENTFLCLYGMEWGVSSSTNGHVVVYGFNQLIGWESGNYDIYNAQTDYDGLFKKVKNNPNAFCYLAHPYTTDFKYLATNPYNATYDSAIVGVPFRSGLAFSTNLTYSDYPAGNYFGYYTQLLAKGYKIGSGYDHDNHYTTFGRSNAGRLVIVAPALTTANLYYAMKNMHFYGSDDWNAKVDFKINGSNIMGDIVTSALIPTISVTHNDGDGELADTIKVWSGVPGSGSSATVLNSVSSNNVLTYTDASLVNNTTKYYFIEIIQTDGQRIVTSPIWYTYNTSAGIESYSNKSGINVFPNPFQNVIYLACPTRCSVEITDVMGRTVYKSNMSSGSTKINTETFDNGIYFINVISESGVIESFKMIKD